MVDWSDLLRRSLLQSSPASQLPSYDELWRKICAPFLPLEKYLSPGPSTPATLLLNSFFYLSVSLNIVLNFVDAAGRFPPGLPAFYVAVLSLLQNT
jgi:hypothetical protein